MTAWTLNTLEAGLFAVVATASPDTDPERLEAALDEEVEKLRLTPPAEEEMQRTHNRIDRYSSFRFRWWRTNASFGARSGVGDH